MPRINIIAALQKNDRAIGKNNDLLVRISDDLKRFKALTTGHPIIMGRKTFASIGRALPNRTNIIITRSPVFTAEGCIIVHSLEEALEKAREVDQEEIFIIGGGEIYTQAFPQTDRLYLTLVDSNEVGNIFFPEYSEFTKEISREDHPEHTPSYAYVILEK